MKVLLEIAIVFLLIAMGWQQSFRDHWLRISGRPSAPTPAGRAAARPGGGSAPNVSHPISATPEDRSWMWKRTQLDPHAK